MAFERPATASNNLHRRGDSVPPSAHTGSALRDADGRSLGGPGYSSSLLGVLSLDRLTVDIALQPLPSGSHDIGEPDPSGTVPCALVRALAKETGYLLLAALSLRHSSRTLD